MGGGGAMRAAAKIAGINAGLRGATPADHPIAAARRAATRPVGPMVSAPEEVSWSGLSASQSNNSIDAAAQRPCWELDDWEFAGGEGDAIWNSGEPLPRVVFGGAPTLVEAKEATDELKDALDKIYLSSPNPTGYKEADHEPGLSLIPKQENMDIKACVVSEVATKSLPTNALKAFRLLNESSAAQSVVASIASDPNVWNAVLQNEALSEFLQSQKKTAPLSDTKVVTEEFVSDTVTEEFVSDTDTADQISRSSYGAFDYGKSPNSGNVFMDFLEGVRSSVVEMMNGLSDYFQNLFAVPSSDKVNEGTGTSIGATFTEKALGASFLGLAVMVIMVVVLKRP